MRIVSANITGSLILNGVDVTDSLVSSSIISSSVNSKLNGITWPNNLVIPNGGLKTQPQLWRNTRGDSLLTSNEVNTGTTANKEQRVYTVPAIYGPLIQTISKNDYNNVFGYRYFTSSLVP
jgi:hypothetical protein